MIRFLGLVLVRCECDVYWSVETGMRLAVSGEDMLPYAIPADDGIGAIRRMA